MEVEIYRLEKYIKNGPGMPSSVNDPTVIERMIVNYKYLFRQYVRTINKGEVHQLVTKCIAYLEDYLDTDELLSKDMSYKSTAVTQIKNYAYKGYGIDLSQVRDRPVVANALKVYFKDLQEPLLTYERYENFSRIGDQEDSPESLRELRVLIAELPVLRRATLTLLIEFLYDVKEHAENNGMTTAILGDIFAPLLMRPRPPKSA